MDKKPERIPPRFYCPLCEAEYKYASLRAGFRGQMVAKKCSQCEAEESATKTGSDR